VGLQQTGETACSATSRDRPVLIFATTTWTKENSIHFQTAVFLGVDIDLYGRRSRHRVRSGRTKIGQTNSKYMENTSLAPL
jgi:hypothetical protein